MRQKMHMHLRRSCHGKEDLQFSVILCYSQIGIRSWNFEDLCCLISYSVRIPRRNREMGIDDVRACCFDDEIAHLHGDQSP